MRILLTNNSLGERAGSELYLRDIAVELMRRGHRPVAYSTNLGRVADELHAATIPVLRSLDCLGEPPDIIHGQHHYETLAAMLRFPQTPAIAYCHGWIPWQEEPLIFPRILRYVAVDELCRERLITEGGIAPERVALLLNFFDARLFPQRDALPAKPRTALVFSNTFREHEGLPVLRDACKACGIELHATGLGIGPSETQPGILLAKYDLVFAKARAAIEAMAVGNAVILCSPERLGRLVTASNFSALRPLNFGVRVLDRPLEKTLLVEEILKYDADDARRVTAIVREQCELQQAMDRLIDVYAAVITESKRSPVSVSAEAEHAAARYLEHHAGRYKGFDAETWKLRFHAADQECGQLRGQVTQQAARNAELEDQAQLGEVEREALRAMLAAHKVEAGLSESQLEQFRTAMAAQEVQAELAQGQLEQLQTIVMGQEVQAGLARAQLEQLQKTVAAQERAASDAARNHLQALDEAEKKWRERLNQVSLEAAAKERELGYRLETKEAERTEMLNWPAWKFANAIWQSYPMRFLVRPASRAVRRRLRWVGAR